MVYSTIRSGEIFNHVKKKGKRHVFPGFILLSTPHTDRSANIGIITSKRLGNAIIRNKIKRRLKAAIRELSTDLSSIPYHFVFIGKKKCLTYPFLDLKKDIQQSIDVATNK